jgi:hypothetical protein
MSLEEVVKRVMHGSFLTLIFFKVFVRYLQIYANKMYFYEQSPIRKVEDTKCTMRSRKSKDKQYNGQKESQMYSEKS